MLFDASHSFAYAESSCPNHFSSACRIGGYPICSGWSSAPHPRCHRRGLLNLEVCKCMMLEWTLSLTHTINTDKLITHACTHTQTHAHIPSYIPLCVQEPQPESPKGISGHTYGGVVTGYSAKGTMQLTHILHDVAIFSRHFNCSSSLSVHPIIIAYLLFIVHM